MSKKWAYALIISFVVLVIAGIVIGAVVLDSQRSFRKDITLSQGGVTKEELSVSLEGMYPGQSVEYTIHIGAKAAAFYDVELSFRAEDEIALAPYVEVEVVLRGKSVAEGSLQEFFGGEPLRLALEIDEDETADIVLRYKMPIDVGNEAQRLTADFQVDFQAAARL